MSLEDEYLGRITPDEAREKYSRAESDCEHMPSAAWRALHAVAGMHYEYAVRTSRDGKDDYVYTSSWYRSYDEAADRAAEVKRVNPHTTIIRRLVSDVEVVA